jgi:hypothetical protein
MLEMEERDISKGKNSFNDSLDITLGEDLQNRSTNDNDNDNGDEDNYNKRMLG